MLRLFDSVGEEVIDRAKAVVVGDGRMLEVLLDGTGRLFGDGESTIGELAADSCSRNTITRTVLQDGEHTQGTFNT